LYKRLTAYSTPNPILRGSNATKMMLKEKPSRAIVPNSQMHEKAKTMIGRNI
jgi:hypothetical protein